MGLLSKKQLFLVQVVLSLMIISFCTALIWRDSNNLSAWMLLTSTVCIWLPNPKIGDRQD